MNVTEAFILGYKLYLELRDSKPLYRIALSNCGPKQASGGRLELTVPSLSVDVALTIVSVWVVAETSANTFEDVCEINIVRAKHLTSGDIFQIKDLDITLSD